MKGFFQYNLGSLPGNLFSVKYWCCNMTLYEGYHVITVFLRRSSKEANIHLHTIHRCSNGYVAESSRPQMTLKVFVLNLMFLQQMKFDIIVVSWISFFHARTRLRGYLCDRLVKI